MGLCIQVTHTLNQNATGGGTFDAMTAATGDTLNVPAFNPGTQARILDVWGGVDAHAGEFDIRSPNFHDNQRGLRMAYDFNPTLSGADGNPSFLTGQHVLQPLYPSDTLVAEYSGTAADKSGLAFLSYYQDLPGCDMQLRTWPQIQNRIVNTLESYWLIFTEPDESTYTGTRMPSRSKAPPSSGAPVPGSHAGGGGT